MLALTGSGKINPDLQVTPTSLHSQIALIAKDYVWKCA